ncbi:hypothetical protein E2C01_001361 [Portunus trituberculatus]|uniref:Uncharacterized protein n=1 Tax=Portunus trituberculatus TaxID=210409 RepID=A0A5B7CH40_PORTR|nr:hypothetical protein [Portunus trituberculatus]
MRRIAFDSILSNKALLVKPPLWREYSIQGWIRPMNRVSSWRDEKN